MLGALTGSVTLLTTLLSLVTKAMNEPQTPNTPEMPGPNRSDDNAQPESTPGQAAPETPPTGAPPGREVPDDKRDPRVGELETVLVHLKADFDNFKKRTQKELGASSRTGELEAVKRFLPALSNLERAVVAAESASGGEVSALLDGLRQVSQQFQGILGALGVERIPAVGAPFDPTLHDAVAAAARPDAIPGTVIDEYEPGYRADGKALIPAKVRVATAE